MRGSIPKSFIHTLIDRTDIVPLIQARLSLKKAGANFMARCPFHEEKSASFTVSSTKQFYHCFGCGVHGNVISFLMEYDRLEFVAAVEYLAAQLGVDVPRENLSPDAKAAAPVSTEGYAVLEEVSRYYQVQLRQSQTAIDYLKGRGLDGKTAKQFAVGYARTGWDNTAKAFASRGAEFQNELKTQGILIQGKQGLVDRFHDRIMFPIRDIRGRVIGFGGRTLVNDSAKYLNSPETPLYHKGEELYGLYEARLANRKLDTLIAVEGYLDVISLAQHGITNVVATSGTATTAKQAQKLFRYAQEIIFCFDGDNAGRNAAWKALTITLPLLNDGMQAKFLFLPEKEDPDSFVRAQGADAFRVLLNNAISAEEFFFGEMQKQTPIRSLDDKARFAKEALPFIQQIPAGLFHNLMLEKLSQLLGISKEELQAVAQGKPPLKSEPRAPQQNKLQAPMRLILALVLQEPARVLNEKTISALQMLDGPGSRLLQRLITAAAAEKKLHIGQLLEESEHPKEKAIIAELANWQHEIPAEDLLEEFNETVERLLQIQKQQALTQLIAKSKTETLTSDEQEMLHRLLLEKREK